MMDRDTLQQYRQVLDEFARGNPEPAKALFSHREDVTLANPWGPAVCGWTKVSEALDFASSRFRDGNIGTIETVAEYASADLATMLQNEQWQAKVSGRQELASFQLRATSTFRREDGVWRLVHRHADPLAAPHPDGPLRASSA